MQCLSLPLRHGCAGICNARGLFSSFFLLLLTISLAGCSVPWLKGSQKAKTNPCVVLALPASGNYAPLTKKIQKGALEAQKGLVASGINLRIENINTEDPEWLKKLSALPEMCAVVGGPFQEKKYLAARKAGLMQNRVFFSFMPTLQAGDEGKVAWRFFSSPQDQVDAIARFATDDMKIRSYGAFYPNDTYGKRMTDLLEKSLSKRNIPLQKTAYTPGATASFSSALKSLINPSYVKGNNSPIPQTTFEALFLPDSWKNMDMITNSLLVNGEDRLVLLGTTLWEASLSGKQIPMAGKYELAIFPAIWNKARAPKQLQAQGNDFWSALGYDFINFAARTEIDRRLESSQVTRQAQAAAGAIKSIAPINWNNNGIASQQLYLFQITSSGPKPMDKESFRQARARALERSALRIQEIRDTPLPPEEPETSEATPEDQTSSMPEANSGEDQAIALPASASSRSPHQNMPAQNRPEQPAPAVSNPQVPGVMSPRPVPSYKLRLPANR